ncbi:c-type cytochrome biogenesis protein CcsB [Pseudonocardia acaciae]|uniref:c-type cytochrome biogenesis protein CcsB n=1 Tax=Pseudonocardia acaciae TaxID=551276 RepID=UPI00048FDC82|nr:c-type cytochrome biogenesis protein CcsB [Pseudonocardia acaciae]
MPVNEALATYSDYAFRTAVVIYLVAMLLHLGEYARVKAPKQLVAVGAGDGLDVAPEASGERTRTDRFGRMAVAMTILGALLHAGSLLTRGLAVMRWPWGNMYEFSSAITLFAVLAWLVVLRRNPGMRRVGAFLLLPVVILLFLGGTALYAQAAPVVPALRSYWLAIHVSAISLATGMLTMAGVASALFLVRRSGNSERSGGFVSMLPAADALDRVAYRVTVIAFPLYTFAIMAGAIWAEAAWGRFWGWDPKETVAFVAWVIYAGYLHARSTAGWRTGRAAWINVAGLVAVLFNLFFVNLVTAGLHSYAGVG